MLRFAVTAIFKRLRFRPGRPVAHDSGHERQHLNDTITTSHDRLWDLAWSWVIRQHDSAGFDAAAHAELTRWLAADPAHRQAFDQAGRLWLAAGLVPPVHDIDIPGAAQDDN